MAILLSTLGGYPNICTNEQFPPIGRKIYRDIRYAVRGEINEPPKSHFVPVHIGAGVTLNGWTDRQAFTVIARKGNVITIQRDECTRLTEMDFVLGGFSAVCTNNDGQRWSCKPNPLGGTLKLSRRKNGAWIPVGHSIRQGNKLSAGRHEFYDYNF